MMDCYIVDDCINELFTRLALVFFGLRKIVYFTASRCFCVQLIMLKFLFHTQMKLTVSTAIVSTTTISIEMLMFIAEKYFHAP